MTDQQHPITPPPEFVEQWDSECESDVDAAMYLATQAARWGADQELEACCEEMKSIPSPLGIPFGEMASNALRAARRPKPLSLKEQALAALKKWAEEDYGPGAVFHKGPEVGLIRRALEQLND